VTKLAAASGSGDNEGWSVALNGGTILSGAIGLIAGRGAAYVFPLPVISAGGIVHAASFAHTVAPGSIASGFGINFAATPTTASTLPLPTTLSEVSLTVNGTPAPLIYVNNLQANFQVPYETQPGTATVIVTANGIPGPPATVTVAALAPGIFVAGTNQAVVLNLDNSLADSGHPAKVASIVIMYVTGLGALDHPIPTGSPASANPVSNAKVVPTVTVGGANATVQFAGMTPGFVGLSQINFVVPKVASGSQPVVVTQGGQTSNNPVMSVSQ
jgi:adhesin/invasin